MNVNYDLRCQVENEVYQIESEFCSPESEVKQNRSHLDWEVDSAIRQLAQAKEFCGTLAAQADIWNLQRTVCADVGI